jgi:hypothetical protein
MAAKKTLRRPLNSPRTEVNPDGPNDDVDEEDLENPSPDTDDTGDADTDADSESDKSDGEEQPGETLPPMLGKPRDGRTFRAGEPVTFKGVKKGGIILCQERIYRGVQQPGSDRFRYHQVLSPGSELSASKVKEISAGEYQANTVL